jgi:hypothetical protein
MLYRRIEQIDLCFAQNGLTNCYAIQRERGSIYLLTSDNQMYRILDQDLKIVFECETLSNATSQLEFLSKVGGYSNMRLEYAQLIEHWFAVTA